MKYVGKILPVDGYHVLLTGSLPTDYHKSLIHLYQPLIGINAVSLYQTLLHEIDMQLGKAIQTHHTLMSFLNLPLDEIYKARLKLEGIGLLNTYEQSQYDFKVYIYELKSPFNTHNFFNDAMLSQLLYHHIGQDKFMLLRKLYTQQKQTIQGDNITASFSEVFKTYQPKLVDIDNELKKTEQLGPKLEEIDFTWIEQMLQQRMIPVEHVLTTENRRIISQMMLLYDLATFEVEKSLLWALSEDNRLDINEFKDACHDLFKSKQNSVIKLTDKRDSNVQSKRVNEKPATKEEQLIFELETISPQQLLADLSNGNQASEQDLKVIREVMVSQGLPGPVMNVLIHYVLLQSNMKLSKAYLETIASHWSRANLKTAKEAMMFAKKEKDRYRKNNQTKTNYRNYNRQTTKEVVPEWFKTRKNNTRKNAITTNNTIDLEKEKAEITALLNQYSSDKK